MPNMNELAKEISEMESGKKELSIAQIKEVIKCIAIIFFRRREYLTFFFKYSDKVGKKYQKENQ